MRSWMTLALVAVLALGNVPSVRAEDTTELNKTLGQINETLKGLQARMDRIDDNLKAENLRGANTTLQVQDLNERIARLERQIADLMNSRGSDTVRRYYEPRSSNYMTPGNTDVVPAPPRGGVIRLENRYNLPVTVYINNQPYSLAPFQATNVEGVPPGVFTYEVMAEGFGVIQQQVARRLPPGGSHNIYINPPAVAAAIP